MSADRMTDQRRRATIEGLRAAMAVISAKWSKAHAHSSRGAEGLHSGIGSNTSSEIRRRLLRDSEGLGQGNPGAVA